MQELDIDGGVAVGRVVVSEGDEDNSSSESGHLSYAEEPEDLVFTAPRMIRENDEDDEDDEGQDNQGLSSQTHVEISMNKLSKTLTSRTSLTVSHPSKRQGFTTRDHHRQPSIHESDPPNGEHISPTAKKHFSRRWFKDKGGKRWEERDVYEVIGALRKL
jgi:hypothetical protein